MKSVALPASREPTKKDGISLVAENVQTSPKLSLPLGGTFFALG